MERARHAMMHPPLLGPVNADRTVLCEVWPCPSPRMSCMHADVMVTATSGRGVVLASGPASARTAMQGDSQAVLQMPFSIPLIPASVLAAGSSAVHVSAALRPGFSCWGPLGPSPTFVPPSQVVHRASAGAQDVTFAGVAQSLSMPIHALSDKLSPLLAGVRMHLNNYAQGPAAPGSFICHAMAGGPWVVLSKWVTFMWVTAACMVHAITTSMASNSWQRGTVCCSGLPCPAHACTFLPICPLPSPPLPSPPLLCPPPVLQAWRSL